jgi:hypothetical protein
MTIELVGIQEVAAQFGAAPSNSALVVQLRPMDGEPWVALA